MTLGEKIKRSRIQAKISQREMANRIGVSQQAIAQFETNRIRPSMDTLRKIADALENSDLLNLDWDLTKTETAVDPEEESFETFMKEHGAFISSRRDDDGALVKCRISFDGETYELPIEMWKTAHQHLYAVCREFIKTIASFETNKDD